jgi:enoyl-[acyl-carrier protein] reductase I
MADVPDAVKSDRRYAKFADFSIQGTVDTVGREFGAIDILIHSVAFSREITKLMKDTSRGAYSEALGISAYSLTSLLRAAEPYMTNRPDGASAVALTYLGGERVVPYYGGGMSTAKAALQIDAKQLAHNLGSKGVRVNLISAGPYASRAARSIRPGEFEKSVEYAAVRSPLPRPITPDEVASATVFLCSGLASGITGQVLYVDCGYHIMAG